MTTKLEWIRAREQAATEGPWKIPEGDLNGRIWAVGPIAGYDYDALEISDEDAAFVSHSRADIPLLLAVAEAAAKAWPRMVSLFEFAALHGITEPDPNIVAFRAAIAALTEEAE